jgi:predicted Zn-dependent peptidase
MNNTYKIHQFPNGIRIAHKQVTHTKITHCGFILDIGSRDEDALNQGIVHFWEHMAFKGTQKRKAFHIINRLETLGGELNAYTSKEKICFYASILSEHFEKALELLTDITFDSIFPEKQIERERDVILEEMAMYVDNPDDCLQDDLDAMIFKQHPLGMNILGTQDTIQSFKREDFRQFIQEYLNTEKIIFSVVGNQSFEKVVKLCEKYFDHIPLKKTETIRLPFKDYSVENQTHSKTHQQAYCGIGGVSYSLYDEKRLPFFLLVNWLGGYGMNSKLNLSLRERNGLVYSVEATYTPFTDTGLFAIYFSTEPKKLDKSIHLIQKEMKNIQQNAFGTKQLHYAKEQLIGQLAIAEESNLNYMLMMGKSILDLGRVDDLELIFEEIKNVSGSQLLEIANEQFVESKLSYLIYSPQNH